MAAMMAATAWLDAGTIDKAAYMILLEPRNDKTLLRFNIRMHIINCTYCFNAYLRNVCVVKLGDDAKDLSVWLWSSLLKKKQLLVTMNQNRLV